MINSCVLLPFVNVARNLNMILLAVLILLAAFTWSGSNCLGATFVPLADPTNQGNWTLVENMSDEFDGNELDSSKWDVQGPGGSNHSRFIGRAPSQFSTDNVLVESGKLKIRTKYDPDFQYSTRPGQGGQTFGSPPITTAAVISKNQLHYGYLEIHAKPAHASISSSFWMTGEHSELDVYEFIGAASEANQTFWNSQLWSSIHDWSPGAGGASTWTDRHLLGFNAAEDFHTYGVEWDVDYLKFHVDGNEVRTVLREDVIADGGERAWSIINPMRVWMDSEAFPWAGLPDLTNDLPADYEIEYVRVYASNVSSNPEPSATGLIVFGALAWISRRRRATRQRLPCCC